MALTASRFGGKAEKTGELGLRIAEATANVPPLQAATVGVTLVVQTVSQNNATQLLAL